MFAESIASYLADFGVPAVWGAKSATVLLDKADEDVLGGRAQSTTYDITYSAADFIGLNHGDSLTVAGVGYQVQTVSQIDDGVFNRARLYRP